MRARARAVHALAREAACDNGLAALGGSAAKWTNVVWPIKSRPTNTHYSFIGIDGRYVVCMADI